MSDNLTAAIIAACVALIVAFLTQFLAENYRRFRDGSAVAAGLAGELSSYTESLPKMRVLLSTAKATVEMGNKDKLLLRPMEKPVDRYFEEVVGKLGLLSPMLIEDVIYVYNNLAAFRMALMLISERHQEMQSQEILARLSLCMEAFERAASRGAPLIVALHARSAQRFLSY